MFSVSSLLKLFDAGIALIETCGDLNADQARHPKARPLMRLHSTYFGSTRFSKQQRLAREAAARRAHSCTTLEKIERYARRMPDATTTWALRLTLCKASATNIDTLGRKAINELDNPEPAHRVALYRRTERTSTLAITGDANVLDAVMRTVDGNVERFRECFFDGGATMPQLTTNVVVPLTDLVRIIDGDTDDICLRTNAGTTITGAEFVQSQLAEHGIFTLVDTMGEPVDAYRTTRFANDKQRLMLEAEYSHCAWDGCKVPVRDCQFHHIIAWRAGGYTNYSNLIPLCAYHNGINEDDPAKPAPRGRFAHRDGRKVFIPGWAGIAINADLPPP